MFLTCEELSIRKKGKQVPFRTDFNLFYIIMKPFLIFTASDVSVLLLQPSREDFTFL